MTDKIKMTFMDKWIADIENDENLDMTEQELAYITYASAMYGLRGIKINIGEVFGKEFKHLNIAMPNIYGQIDLIKNYDQSPGRVLKYDSEEIKKLRLEGKTAKEICNILGYPEEKIKSITTNKGWKDAGQMLSRNTQSSTESVQSSFDF